MEFCPTLDTIGDYFIMALQGSQLRLFRNINIGINEDDIPAYNAFGRALLEELKLKRGKRNNNPIRLPNSQATRSTKECVRIILLTEVY